ncbi:MAG: MFS transporter [Bacteroidales bacterium]|nr:MFS transporter [Bacteroidales bacterium]
MPNKSHGLIMLEYSKKTVRAWCSYDIANSVYKLLITTVLFPNYYAEVTAERVYAFGFELRNTVAYDFALAIAYLLVAFVSPMLSGMADYGSKRKRYMTVFSFIGAVACFGMYWYNGNNLSYGFLTIIFAAIGYEAAVLFYNSFLPLIAPKSEHDRISGMGYAWGYAGSMILLSINLLIIMKYEWFGFGGEKPQLQALRVSFLQVGIWWFALSWIALSLLKDPGRSSMKYKDIFSKGFKELMQVQNAIKKSRVTKRFLFSFFFYSSGLQTLMLVAILFGKNEIGVKGVTLIVTIVILQLVAIVGALFFSYLSKLYGNKASIISMLFIWLSVCIGGYFVQNTVQFFFLAAGVGLVMGGIQSQSRSTFSKLIPKNSTDTASYFSFYNFAEKLAIVFGLVSVGLIEHLTDNMRNITIALGIFFVVALLLMWKTPLNAALNQQKD